MIFKLDIGDCMAVKGLNICFLVLKNLILFYLFIFIAIIKMSSEAEKMYQILKNTVDKMLNQNGYGIVNLAYLFQGL